jgi:hypothetical protein
MSRSERDGVVQNFGSHTWCKAASDQGDKRQSRDRQQTARILPAVEGCRGDVLDSPGDKLS